MTTRYCLFSDSESYSRADIMEALGLKDSRPLDAWLKSMRIKSVPLPGHGKKEAFSGKALNDAIYRKSKWSIDAAATSDT